MVVEHGKDGVLQNDLWKSLKLTSRDGSRIAIRLEKRGMVKRKKMLDGGRWTYRLTSATLPAQMSSIEHAPCISCPVELKCSPEGAISPRTCGLIEDWLVLEHAEQIKNVKVAAKKVPIKN